MGGTSQAGLPRAAGSRKAVHGDDVAGRVGGITAEEAVGVCVEAAEHLRDESMEFIWVNEL